MTPERRKEIFNKAADIVETRGWCQMMMEGPNGSVCMAGGMQYAIYGNLARLSPWPAPVAARIEYSEAFDIVQDLLKNSVVSWNDSKGRTKEEVIETLRKVAECI